MAACKRVAISGKMTSGKTTASNYLCNTYGFARLSFADPLRELERIQREGVDKERRVKDIVRRALVGTDLCTEEHISKLVGMILDAFGLFPVTVGVKNRPLLQYLGTEVGRKFYNDIWVNYLLNTLSEIKDDHIVVDDMRFKNELTALRLAGFTCVRLQIGESVMQKRVREIYGPDSDVWERYLHPSEIDLDEWVPNYFDHVINTEGDCRFLYAALDAIVGEGTSCSLTSGTR